MAEAKTISKKFKVLNEYGIHARPAALLVQTAGKFESDIVIEKDGNQVSCKSIMGLMTLEGYKGSMLGVTAAGADAAEAMKEIEELFASKFYED
ncbi:MAG: HPr family phosphocarrier protein [Kiritimatiellales bacterium]|nr:HPr family phosphocarrier protein [Kiritimatiellales bacterium]